MHCIVFSCVVYSRLKEFVEKNRKIKLTEKLAILQYVGCNSHTHLLGLGFYRRGQYFEQNSILNRTNCSLTDGCNVINVVMVHINTIICYEIGSMKIIDTPKYIFIIFLQ